MAALAVITTQDNRFRELWNLLRRKLSLDAELQGNNERLEQVRRIVDKVRANGDKAVAGLTAEYDKVELTSADFRIPTQQLAQAHQQMDPRLLSALKKAITNVRAYQEKIKVTAISDWQNQGLRLGVRYTPLRRVGVCIPGASAPLLSTVIMTVVPAQVAGVQEIAVISAPRCQGSIHPAILGLCHELGVQDVYRISGAQAVAALAYGTDTIGKVDKIVGPGNWWGQLAKKEVYGVVDIDSFAGQSEVLVVADSSAQPEWVAADLLSQAEHAPGGGVVLTPDPQLAQAVAQAVDIQLEQNPRSQQTRQCVEEFSLAVVTADLDEAVALANEFAAEHLQIQCHDSDQVASRIVNAGAIFIGPYSPVAVGDYYAGPSHTLPTGGTARFFSALNVNDFLKQTSIIAYDQESLCQHGPDIQTIAEAEGLSAHASSVKIRTA